MEFSTIEFRLHAIQRMFERGISVPDVKHVVKSGKIIESYPEDKPFQSYLLLGFIKEKPLHVVASVDPRIKKAIIITVYEPDSSMWKEGFEKRK